MRAMCCVQLRTNGLMLVMCLIEAIDPLTMASNLHLYGHILS